MAKNKDAVTYRGCRIDIRPRMYHPSAYSPLWSGSRTLPGFTTEVRCGSGLDFTGPEASTKARALWEAKRHVERIRRDYGPRRWAQVVER